MLSVDRQERLHSLSIYGFMINIEFQPVLFFLIGVCVLAKTCHTGLKCTVGEICKNSTCVCHESDYYFDGQNCVGELNST